MRFCVKRLEFHLIKLKHYIPWHIFNELHFVRWKCYNSRVPNYICIHTKVNKVCRYYEQPLTRSCIFTFCMFFFDFPVFIAIFHSHWEKLNLELIRYAIAATRMVVLSKLWNAYWHHCLLSSACLLLQTKNQRLFIMKILFLFFCQKREKLHTKKSTAREREQLNEEANRKYIYICTQETTRKVILPSSTYAVFLTPPQKQIAPEEQFTKSNWYSLLFSISASRSSVQFMDNSHLLLKCKWTPRTHTPN